MIAKITYEDAELGTVSATLGDDLTWTADDPDLVRTLEALISAADQSPARGHWARYHAGQMAEMLGGEIEFGAQQPRPVGALY